MIKLKINRTKTMGQGSVKITTAEKSFIFLRIFTYNAIKIFQKVPKNAFLAGFSETCLWRGKFRQNGVFIVIWESSENQFVRTEKKATNFSIFF